MLSILFKTWKEKKHRKEIKVIDTITLSRHDFKN